MLSVDLFSSNPCSVINCILKRWLAILIFHNRKTDMLHLGILECLQSPEGKVIDAQGSPSREHQFLSLLVIVSLLRMHNTNL